MVLREGQQRGQGRAARAGLEGFGVDAGLVDQSVGDRGSKVTRAKASVEPLAKGVGGLPSVQGLGGDRFRYVKQVVGAHIHHRPDPLDG